MDKYTYSLKVEKIQKLVRQEEYVQAAKIADTMEWGQERNVRLLTSVAEAYEMTGQYSKAIDVLLTAYERSSAGKRFMYKLTELAIAAGDLTDAESFYRKYLEEAPEENNRFILRYKIAEAKGESLDKRITILETYKKYEFEEEWACRLAELYAQAGLEKKCVSLCDEIILWFSVGPYVDRAMELKEKFQPLTDAQREHRENREYYEAKVKAVANEMEEAVAQKTASLEEEEDQEEPQPEQAADPEEDELPVIAISDEVAAASLAGASDLILAPEPDLPVIPEMANEDLPVIHRDEEHPEGIVVAAGSRQEMPEMAAAERAAEIPEEPDSRQTSAEAPKSQQPEETSYRAGAPAEETVPPVKEQTAAAEEAVTGTETPAEASPAAEARGEDGKAAPVPKRYISPRLGKKGRKSAALRTEQGQKDAKPIDKEENRWVPDREALAAKISREMPEAIAQPDDHEVDALPKVDPEELFPEDEADSLDYGFRLPKVELPKVELPKVNLSFLNRFRRKTEEADYEEDREEELRARARRREAARAAEKRREAERILSGEEDEIEPEEELLLQSRTKAPAGRRAAAPEWEIPEPEEETPVRRRKEASAGRQAAAPKWEIPEPELPEMEEQPEPEIPEPELPEVQFPGHTESRKTETAPETSDLHGMEDILSAAEKVDLEAERGKLAAEAEDAAESRTAEEEPEEDLPIPSERVDLPDRPAGTSSALPEPAIPPADESGNEEQDLEDAINAALAAEANKERRGMFHTKEPSTPEQMANTRSLKDILRKTIGLSVNEANLEPTKEIILPSEYKLNHKEGKELEAAMPDREKMGSQETGAESEVQAEPEKMQEGIIDPDTLDSVLNMGTAPLKNHTGDPEKKAAPLEEDAGVIPVLSYEETERAAWENHASRRITEPDVLDSREMEHCLWVMTKEGEDAVAKAVAALEGYYHSRKMEVGPIAKIAGDRLNQRGLVRSLPQLANKDLIIDGAESLSPDLIREILRVVRHLDTDKVFVLMDREEEIGRLKQRFRSQISAAADAEPEATEEEVKTESPARQQAEQKRPVRKVRQLSFDRMDPKQELSEREFVRYADYFAHELECVIDDSGFDALEDEIDAIRQEGGQLLAGEVEDIIEDAAEHASRPSLSRIFGSKYDKDGFLILRGRDFR